MADQRNNAKFTPGEALKLFNDFQSQSRTRIEATVKLVLVVSGVMLTLSVGAILRESAPNIPARLLPALEWGWVLLFYSIAASLLLTLSMIIATFHMGVLWQRALRRGSEGIAFFGTWLWLRIFNGILGVSAIVGCAAGIGLIAYVALGVAESLGSTAAAQSQKQAPSPTAPRTTSQPPNQRAQSTQQESDTERRGATQPPPTSETEAAEDAKEKREKLELDRKLVDFNGQLAFYTLILAVIAGLQFLVLMAQAIFLRRAFQESRRAGDIARDAMIAGERAFVFAVQIFSSYESVPGTTLYNWRFRPQWQNSGDTPTRNLIQHTHGELRNDPLPPGFDFDYATEDTGTGLIPPKVTLQGGVFPASPRPAITTQDILEIQEGRKFLFLWGWARYHDVFAGTPQHITRFCWLITPIGNPMTFVPESQNPAERLTFTYIYHHEGNCADEECQQRGA